MRTHYLFLVLGLTPESNLLTPSVGNCLFAYRLVLKHLQQNVILPFFCIPKVLKSATKNWKLIDK